MKFRWYIGVLLLLFACIGAFQDQASVPNQEVVLEFVDEKVDENDIKSTIADVQEKLLEIGVSNIQVTEKKGNTLKISYYSITPIDNIKEILLEENQLIVDQNSDDKNKEEKRDSSADYKINVYKLTDDTKLANKDKLVFENQYKTDRSIVYNYGFVKSSKVSKANQLYKTAYNNYKNNPFTKDYTSHKEPEVRAGPHTYYI
jgi:hypothetical protein